MKTFIALLGLFIALSLTGCGDNAAAISQPAGKELSVMYKTGTVSVVQGSKNVTGVGMVAAGNYSAGDAFTTGDKWYTIESVTSDAAFVLTVPYTGTTGSGLPYSIVKVFSPPVDATALNGLQAKLDVLQAQIDALKTSPIFIHSVDIQGIPLGDPIGYLSTDQLTVRNTAFLTDLLVSGNAELTTAGGGLRVRGGTNARVGTAAINFDNKIVVANTSVATTSRIFATITGGVTAGAYITNITKNPGVGFTINLSAGVTTCYLDWFMVEQI